MTPEETLAYVRELEDRICVLTTTVLEKDQIIRDQDSLIRSLRANVHEQHQVLRSIRLRSSDNAVVWAAVPHARIQ